MKLHAIARVLLPLPLHHVYPLVVGLFVPLSLGLTVILPYSVTGPQLIRAIINGDVTVIIGVPRLYRALYDGIVHSVKARKGLSSVLIRTALNLSFALRRHLCTRAGSFLLSPLRKRIGPNLRVLASGGSALSDELFIGFESIGWQIGVGYGLTETAPLLTINPPNRAVLGSAGRPVKGVERCIDTSAAAGKPEQGEIQARGPGIFKGYRNLPSETAKALLLNYLKNLL